MAHLTTVTLSSSPPHVCFDSEVLTPAAACATVLQLSHTDTEDVSCSKEWGGTVWSGRGSAAWAGCSVLGHLQIFSAVLSHQQLYSLLRAVDTEVTQSGLKLAYKLVK